MMKNPDHISSEVDEGKLQEIHEKLAKLGIGDGNVSHGIVPRMNDDCGDCHQDPLQMLIERDLNAPHYMEARRDTIGYILEKRTTSPEEIIEHLTKRGYNEYEIGEALGDLDLFEYCFSRRSIITIRNKNGEEELREKYKIFSDIVTAENWAAFFDSYSRE